jgi:hypothetical protein
MGEKSFNTNLASEFYVLSMLNRIGADALLTLGNKKAVDIAVKKDGRTLTIDVKGLRGTTGFPIDNCAIRNETHYLVFVSFLKKMEDAATLPDVFIVPSKDLDKKHKELGGESLVYQTPDKNRTLVQYSRLKKLSGKYKDRWAVFVSGKW